MRLVQLGAIDGVDHGAKLGRHDAHDAVARQRMAALAQRIGNAYGEAANGNGLGLATALPARLGRLARALQFGEDRFQHFMAAQRAAPDSGIDVGSGGQAQLLRHLLHRLLGHFAGFVGEGFFQDLAA